MNQSQGNEGAPEIIKPPASPPADIGPYRRRDYERLGERLARELCPQRCELIRGRLYESPPFMTLEAIVVGVLTKHLNHIADAEETLALHLPLDVVLADHSVVQPDIIYVSKDRLAIGQDRIE